MSDQSAKSAPSSGAITSALHGLLKAVAAYERAGRLAYHCRWCGYAADKKWEAPCPGCGGFYNTLDKADRERMKDAIVAATVRYADAVKGVEGFSWQAVHAYGRLVTASIAVRLARFAGARVDDLLCGKYPPLCPHCGQRMPA